MVVGPTFAYLRLNSVGGYSEALEDEACLPAIFTSTQIHKYCCKDSYEYIKKLSLNIYIVFVTRSNYLIIEGTPAPVFKIVFHSTLIRSYNIYMQQIINKSNR